jgi:hypothetical protein
VDLASLTFDPPASRGSAIQTDFCRPSALSAIVLYQLLRPGHMRDTEKEPAEVVAPSQPDE